MYGFIFYIENAFTIFHLKKNLFCNEKGELYF
jgi:hypothetical protein